MPAPDPVIYAEYLTVHGSRAYGLNNEQSDWDLRGFFMPAPEHLLGFIHGPEQRSHKALDLDVVAWDIRKFFRLAAACNPNVIETLFTEPEDQTVKGYFAERVLAIRRLFLSKRARKSFGGYAYGQLCKIKTGDWTQDTTRKEAMHALRLIRFGTEILGAGELSVRCPRMLRHIRDGAHTQENVVRAVELGLQDLDKVGEASLLPDHPDEAHLNSFLVEILQDHLKAST